MAELLLAFFCVILGVVATVSAASAGDIFWVLLGIVLIIFGAAVLVGDA